MKFKEYALKLKKTPLPEEFWILALGVILRIIYLIKPRSFWSDEWFTIFVSQQSLKDTILSGLRDVHPPLQFILYHFGGYKFWPFLAGILSLYFFSKLSKDKLATFIFAISPYFIHLSGEARGYGFLVLFSILVFSGYYWALPLGFFTEHYSIFLLLSFPIFSITWWKEKAKKYLWLVPFLAIWGCLLIYQMQYENALEPGRIGIIGWSPLSLVKKICGLLVQFGGAVQYSFLTTKQALSLLTKTPLVLFALPSVLLLFSRDKKYWRIFLVTILTLLLLYPIKLSARYIPFCGICYLLLIIDGYRNLHKKNKLLASLLITCFICVNLFSLGWLFSVKYDPYHREDYISASEYIENNFKPSDGLIGCRKQISFYTKKDFPENGNTLWEVYVGNPDMKINLNTWQGQQIALKRKLTEAKRFGDLVWVVKYEKTKDINFENIDLSKISP